MKTKNFLTNLLMSVETRGSLDIFSTLSRHCLDKISVDLASPAVFPFRSQKSIGFSTTKSRSLFAKIAAVLCLLLTVGIGNAWGAAATLPVNYSFGDGKSSLPTGVTQNGLGSDYAAGNAPYRLKFDGNGDYIQIQVDAAAETITIGVKEFGTSGASIQIQGSADGSSFTTIQTLSFSQGQNKTSSQSTSNSISSSYRYFRVKRNSGSNFGLGTLAITKAASTCTKTVAITKGSESHGEVTTIGSANVSTCSSTASDRQVTITITPDGCYDAPSSLTWTKTSGTVTASKQSGPTDNGNGTYSYVYQFAQNDNGEGTFGVTCTAKAAGKTVNFNAGPGVSASSSLTETCDGSGVTLPNVTASGVCKGWTTFAGWATAVVSDSTTTNPGTLYAADANFVPSSNGQILYAVYSKTKGGGAPVSVTGGDISNGTYGTGLSASHADFYSNNGFKFKAVNNYVETGDISSNNYTALTVKLKAGHNGGSGSVLTIASYNNSDAVIDSKTFTPTEAYTSQSTTYSFDLSGSDVIKKIRITMTSKTNNLGMKYFEVFTGGSTTYYCSDPDCSTNPVLYVTPNNLSFGTVLQGSTPVQQTFTLSGNHLTTGALALTAPDGYTVSPSSVDIVNHAVAATTITVTPSTANTGFFNGNVSISGGGADPVTVALSMTVNAAHTVTWYVDGDTYNEGDPTTLVASGSKVTTLPTTPAGNTIGDCANNFMGWSESNLGATSGQSAPADLFTDIAGSPTISANKIFYAIFAEAGGDESEFNFGYSDWGKASSFSGNNTSFSSVTQTVDGVTATYAKTADDANLYANTTALRFYKKNTLTFTASSAITSIIFTGSSFQTDVTSNVGTCTATSEGLSWTGSATSVTFSRPDNASSYMTLNSATVTVGSGAATNYRTSCGARITAVDDLWVTSTKDKRVKIVVPVKAAAFSSSTNLNATLDDNTRFTATWGANGNTVSSSLETSVIIQYTPDAYDAFDDAELTIAGGGVSTTVTIHGRSLPQKFVIAAQVNNTKAWKAVPANIASAGTPEGIAIETDNDNAPSAATADYNNALYTLTEVDATRYASYGTAVRFSAFTGGNMLWGTAEAAGTSINDVAGAASANQEWVLHTTNGRYYTIENVAYNEANTPGAYKLKCYNNTTFGMYAEANENLLILGAGCETPPALGSATPTENSVTLTWTNASTATIKLYSDAACTKDETVYNNRTSPTEITGLFSGYTYYYKISLGGCVSEIGTFTTEESENHMTIAEWQENAVVISFNGETADLTLSTYKEENQGQQSDNVADELFFSKYFEAQGAIKLLGIFNGTKETKSLSNYKIKVAQGEKITKWGGKLGSYVYNLSALGSIAPSQEIIIISYTNDDKTTTDLILAKNPNGLDYVRAGDGGSFSQTLSFSGDDAIGLFKDDELIDIIGAGCTDTANVSSVTTNKSEMSIPNYHDDYCWINTEGEAIDGTTPYTIATNLCLLIRKPSVHSGANAVAKNTTDFVTLPEEWIGKRVIKDNQSTCDNFDYVGTFDYSEHFEEYSTLTKDEAFDGLKTDVDPWDGTYTIPVANLASMACSNVRIDLADANSGTVISRKDFKVPIMISGDKYTNDDIFNNNDKGPEVCKTCDVVILANASLEKLSTTDAEHDAVEVRDVKVYQGGSLIVPSGKTYKVRSLALRREGDAVSKAQIAGTLDVTDANGIYLDVHADGSNWHFFSLPYDCSVDDITYADGAPATIGTDFRIQYYDGAWRAEHKSGGWKDLAAGATLEAGHGYVIGMTGDENIKKEIRLPMSKSLLTYENSDKEITGFYAYGCTDDKLTPNHKGWNLLGNPYLMAYTSTIAEPLPMGELQPDGQTWTRDGKSVRYIVEPIDNGISGYTQTAIGAGFDIPPFTSYFVQIGGANPATNQSITFDKDQKKSSIVRREVKSEEPNYPIWIGLELYNPKGESDNTALLISDKFTDDYDMMDDLVKMRGTYYKYPSVTTKPVLASRNSKEELAFNALPDNSAAVVGVPLNYYAAQEGTFTFTIDSRYGLEDIREASLYDATTGQYYDLLTDNYSFQTAKGDNTNRFRLFVRVERKQQDVTTDNDNLLVDGELSLTAVDNTLLLSGLTEAAEVYVYDMSGKLLTSDRANGNGAVWRAHVPATGVYFVRVNGAQGQQTLRTIVK